MPRDELDCITEYSCGTWPSRTRLATAGVCTSTSEASTRPLVCARGSSVWLTTPCRVSPSWARTWLCWWAGKVSMIRSMVLAAPWVCRVPSTSWPVSAAVSAIPIDSGSRNSPISTTSGSCRRMWRSASAKDGVSVPISRWCTSDRLDVCTYSIGSSIVMMCDGVSRLMMSTIAASVVDLPEPVGPVTSTSPRGRSASWRATGGMPSSARVRTACGTSRSAAATPPTCRNTLTRNRPTPAIVWARSISPSPR